VGATRVRVFAAWPTLGTALPHLAGHPSPYIRWWGIMGWRYPKAIERRALLPLPMRLHPSLSSFLSRARFIEDLHTWELASSQDAVVLLVFRSKRSISTLSTGSENRESLLNTVRVRDHEGAVICSAYLCTRITTTMRSSTKYDYIIHVPEER
jgi:hypothetical protein